MPVTWLVVLAVLGLVGRPVAWRRRWLLALAALTLAFTNGALINELLLAWELPPVRLSALPPTSDAGVLLTGITRTHKSPHDRVYLAEGADRLTGALWLYRAGRIRRILISGGSGDLDGRAVRSEAAELRTLLLLAGVPRRDILVETRSRNTRENALFTKQLLARHPDVKSLVLITSAYHERRALACFRQVGLHPVAFPAGYYATDREATFAYWLLPDAGALLRWTRLVHEWTGFAVYKLLSYV